MEILSSENTARDGVWIEITFLTLYSCFLILNIIFIKKFANCRELLSTLILLTSLAALLCKFSVLNYLQCV